MDYEPFAKEHYYRDPGRRADEAMAAKVSSGLPSGRIPLGYLATVDGTRVERDAKKAPLVAEAFTLAAEGVPLRKIIRSATAAGLLSRVEQSLSASSLHLMLTNPFYCGFIRYGGELHRGYTNRSSAARCSRWWGIGFTRTAAIPHSVRERWDSHPESHWNSTKKRLFRTSCHLHSVFLSSWLGMWDEILTLAQSGESFQKVIWKC